MTKKTIAVIAAAALTILILGGIAWLVLRPPAETGLYESSGRIEGRITLVTPRSTGTVAQLRAEEGQAVAAGAVLAVLDDPAIRARLQAEEENQAALARRLAAADRNLALVDSQVGRQVAQAEAGLRQARARAERARTTAAQAARDAERARELVDKRFLSEQAAEAAALKAAAERRALEEAEAGVDHAREQLELARLGRQQVPVLRAERDALARQAAQAEARAIEQRGFVQDFEVRSPLAGVVLTRNVESGERVGIGTPLFSLVDLNRLYLKIYVPEPDIGKIALGQEARIYVDAYPGRAFPARVSKVASQAEFTPKNVETREERVKLVFAVELSIQENPGGVLKPGMPADGVIRITPDAPWPGR